MSSLPTVPGTPIDNALLLAFTVAALWAGVMELSRRWRATALYFILYGLLILAWTWVIPRLLVPLIPVLALIMVAGTERAVRRFGAGRSKLAAAAVATGMILTGLGRPAPLPASSAKCDRAQNPPDPACLTQDQLSFFEAVTYLRASTDPETVVFSAKPEPLYLFTSRRGLHVQRTLQVPATEYIPYLESRGARYVLLGSLRHFEPGEMLNQLEPNCGRLELLRRFPPRTYLFRVRDADAPPDRQACAALAEYRRLNVNRDFGEDRAGP